MRNSNIGLVLIILLAFFLRFWQLGNNPPSLSWDEAAWGYNAYSLGIDGRDEFGKFLPLQYLESFGDFKPPVYAYLTILPVKIFGLNEFSTRFPSAFFGTLTVFITYFLAKRIFPKLSTFYFLLSTFLLAISPWHINLSRAAFEANVASFFIVCGVWLFLCGVRQKDSRLTVVHLTLSVISFILSMYTFNTARIVAPLLVLGLTLGFWKKLLAIRAIKKEVLLASIIGIIVFAPLGQFLITPQAKLRFQEVNIFSDTGLIQRANQEIANDENLWWSKIIHNRRVFYVQGFLKHYFDHFNPAFLFIKGDGNPKFSTQDVGQLYLWDLPFLMLGIFLLLRQRQGYWWVIPLWLVIGIIPAATARETPHALRIETTLPVWQILIAYGFYHFLEASRKHQVSSSKVTRALVLTTFYLLLTTNIVYYLHGYYRHYPREFSKEWQYGYKQAIDYIQRVADQYDQIRFTDSLGRPYIYFLFYTKTSPEQFRQTAKIWREVIGFVHVDGFAKYRFARDLTLNSARAGKVLYIDIPNNVPNNSRILKEFYLLNGQAVLTAYSL